MRNDITNHLWWTLHCLAHLNCQDDCNSLQKQDKVVNLPGNWNDFWSPVSILHSVDQKSYFTVMWHAQFDVNVTSFFCFLLREFIILFSTVVAIVLTLSLKQQLDWKKNKKTTKTLQVAWTSSPVTDKLFDRRHFQMRPLLEQNHFQMHISSTNV